MKPKPFSFFPVFDKEANDKVVSQVFKANKSPMELLIWANKAIKFHNTYGLTKEELAKQVLNND